MPVATIIFPDQLFEHPESIPTDAIVFLVEEWLYFRQYQFHRQKLMFHRASMQSYRQRLAFSGIEVRYIESTDPLSDIRKLIPHLASIGISAIHYVLMSDDWLRKRISKSCEEHNINQRTYRNPGFLNEPGDVASFFQNQSRYFMADFYIYQRKLRKILINEDGRPVGGKWSFDQDNRKKWPARQKTPFLNPSPPNEYVKEARSHVQQYFPDAYGVDRDCLYPIDHLSSSQWLDEFLQHRLTAFGPYQDAMMQHDSFLFHSVLTPMLNTGLLLPQQIIDRVLLFASKNTVPINSLEGFIRQVIGWREFVHIVYQLEGGRQRTTNYWNFKRKIPASFWDGTTGIEPIDLVIQRILKTGYCHHIERLMVLGNFMLLCEFDPDEVYQWFMEMFIDSYDWVMVPNVYGMSQFSDGGRMTTKPYIGGSNYLLKMGNWPRGEWEHTWDGLFWRFIHLHREFFMTNARMRILVNHFDKLSPEQQSLHLHNASIFLEKLDTIQ